MLVSVEYGYLEEIWKRSRVNLGKNKEYSPPTTKETKASRPQKERRSRKRKGGSECDSKKLERTKSNRQLSCRMQKMN